VTPRQPLARALNAPARPAVFGPSPLARLLSVQTPLFTAEGPQNYQAAYKHNAAFAKPGSYQTVLPPPEEAAFRQWLAVNRVSFNPNAKTVDYDMRGYYAANPLATHRSGQHFPDTFKTPYDTTFSGESKYAKPHTPFVWQGNKLIDTRTGQVISR
jgi:hypothetical protein